MMSVEATEIAVRWITSGKMGLDPESTTEEVRDQFCDCFPELEDEGIDDEIQWSYVAAVNCHGKWRKANR